jgi:hypothetical protein
VPSVPRPSGASLAEWLTLRTLDVSRTGFHIQLSAFPAVPQEEWA